MEINQLEAFDRVVKEGNFSRAADALGLTQPAVSTRIALLEAELGGPLFERRGRTLHLTALGETFLPFVERMLIILAETKQSVQDYHAGKLGKVKIAAPTPFLLGMMTDVLTVFQQKYPNVDVLIRERDKITILGLLHDHVVALGLVNAPIFDTTIQQVARFQDPIRAVVSPHYPLARHPGPLTLRDLYSHTIFRVSMFPRMSAFMDELVEQTSLSSGKPIIAVPMVMARRLVEQGQGITFLPETYVKHPVAQGEMVVLQITDMPTLYSTPLLIRLKARQLDRAHQAFVEVFISQWRHLLVG
jgi:DNA-binding transcriptional LysR family regulator